MADHPQYDKAIRHLNAIIRLVTEISNEVVGLTESADSLVKTRDHSPIFRYYWELGQAVDAVESALKPFNKHHSDMKAITLPALLEETGLETVRVPDIKRSFTTLIKYSATVLDKVGAYAWLREQGAGDLITETVNANTLTGYLKSRLIEEAKEPPPDLFKLSSYRLISSSAYTPKPGDVTKMTRE